MNCMDEQGRQHIAHRMSSPSRYKALVVVLLIALAGGVGTGYALAATQSASPVEIITGTPKQAETAHQDTQTFKDFAEGKITKKPEAKAGTYAEGTHLLVRDGAVPVALTSSVVDLSQYEEKKVKVYGETQKAIKEGWLMDVGKVEEVN